MAEERLTKRIPHGFLARRRSRLALVAAVAAVAHARLANAQFKYNNWIAGSGNWTNAANWSTGVPSSGQTVNFIESDGVSRAITYDDSSGAPVLYSFTIDLAGGSAAATNTFLIADHVISPGELVVGLSGNATVAQSGGVVDPLSVVLAANTGSTGSYTLTGISALNVLSKSGEKIGEYGLGEFSQSGGANTTINLELGDLFGSTGTYNLGGAGSIISDGEAVGIDGTGEFNQAGGTNNVGGGDLQIAIGVGSKGTYSLGNTGSLTVAGLETVGDNGIGIFNQTGGAHTVGFGNETLNDLEVGAESFGIGTYFLNGTGSLTVHGDEVLGGDGHAAFCQTGGANSIDDVLYIGQSDIAIATYAMSGTSSLTSTIEYIGDAGNGGFTQSGGTNSAFSISVGNASGSTGIYTLTGAGSLFVASDSEVANSGTGTFIQSGGDSEFNGNLLIGYGKGSSGAFTLTGGMCNVSESLSIGGHGKFPGGAAIFNVNGPSASLNVASAINVFNTPGSGLNISAGTITAASLNLVGGTFAQSGGSAIFSNLTGSGTATLTGGALTLSLGGVPSQLGSLNISGPGTLDLQLGGYSQGVSYDLLNLTNASSLGGTLELDLVNGFVPQVGDQFTVMTDGSPFIGQFNNFTSNDDLFTFTADYGASHNLVEITVTSVPEPGIAGVFMLGVLAMRRRRRG